MNDFQFTPPPVDAEVTDVVAKPVPTPQNADETLALYHDKLGVEPSATEAVGAGEGNMLSALMGESGQNINDLLTPEQSLKLNQQLRAAAKEQGYDHIDNPDGTVTLIPPSGSQASGKTAALLQTALAVAGGTMAGSGGFRTHEGLYKAPWMTNTASGRPRAPISEEVRAARAKTAAEIEAHNAAISVKQHQDKMARKAAKKFAKTRLKAGLTNPKA